MYIVIFVSIIALLFTVMESRGKMQGGMKKGFYLLTILACIHYNYGNDYPGYYQLYNEISQIPFDLGSILNGDVYNEPGWVLINYLFKYLGGFFSLVAVLNILQNIIFYCFIRDNVNKEWWWLAMIVYVFKTSFYVMNFSMMRQGLAIAIFVACWTLIKTPSLKRNAIAAVIMFLASFVHHSAIILVPFCFWSFLPVKNGKIWATIYISLFLLMYLSRDVLDTILTPLLSTDVAEMYLDKYSQSQEKNLTVGFGFVLLLIPFIVSLVYLFKKDADNISKSLVMLGAIGTMIGPISLVVPIAGRLGSYFMAFTIATCPITYTSISSVPIKKLLIGLFLLVTLYDYYYFFFVDITWAEHYREFHTIFEVLFS